MNFYYVCGRHTAQPSPWTVPEIRAHHDYMTRVDDWLVDNSELELDGDDMPIAKRGENLDELITEARFERVLRLELHQAYSQMQRDHANDMKNSPEYHALYDAEKEERPERCRDRSQISTKERLQKP